MNNFFFVLAVSGSLILLGLSRQFKATRYFFLSKSAIASIDIKTIPKYLRITGIMEIMTGLMAAGLTYVTYQVFKLNILMLVWIPALALAFAASLYINKKYMGYIRKLEWAFSVAFIIAASVAITYFCPYSFEINSTFDAIQSVNGEVENVEKVTVDINGIYKRYVIKKDVFEGTIKISGYDFTYNGSTVKCYFSNSYASLDYINYTGEGQELLPVKTLGLISISHDFEKLLICINQAETNGVFISAPATNRTQAIDVAKEISAQAKADWLSEVVWN